MSRISAQPGVSDPWMDAYDAVVAPQVPQTGDDPWMAAYDAVVGTQTNSAESGQTAPGIVPAGMPGMAATIPVGGMSRVPAPAHGVVGDIGAGLATGVGQAVSQVGGAMEAVGNVMPGGIGRRFQQAGAQTVEMGQADAGQFPQPTTFAGQIAQSVPGLAAAVGAGALTGGAGGLLVGAGTAGAQSGGQQYNDAKARVIAAGGTQQQARDVATAEAGPMALFSAATSVVPMGRYLNRFSPNVLNKAVGRLSQRASFRLLGDAAAEGSQEAAEELASMTLQAIAEDDPEAFRDWGTRLATSGAGGAILGGGLGATTDIAGRIGGTRGVQDAHAGAPAPNAAPDQGAGVVAPAVAPSGAVGTVAADVPGNGGVEPQAPALNPFTMSDAEVEAMLERLDPATTPDAAASTPPASSVAQQQDALEVPSRTPSNESLPQQPPPASTEPARPQSEEQTPELTLRDPARTSPESSPSQMVQESLTYQNPTTELQSSMPVPVHAITTKDGRVLSDPSAMAHFQVADKYGVAYEDVADSGWMVGDKYESSDGFYKPSQQTQDTYNAKRAERAFTGSEPVSVLDAEVPTTPPTPTAGSPVLTNPTPPGAKRAWEPLEQDGFEFRTDRVKGMYTTIGVYKDGTWVGEATFAENQTFAKSIPLGDGEMFASNVWVDPKFQRRGIATAMYQFAEHETGKIAKPTGNQTDDAKAFWNQSGRSFGSTQPAPAGAAVSKAPAPTTAQEWRAEARRLGVSDKGSLRVVRERVRAARSQSSTSDIQPSQSAPAIPEPNGPPSSSIASPDTSPRATVPPAGREAWEMTRAEYVDASTTKHLPSDTYAEVSSRQPAQVDAERYPVSVRKFTDNTGAQVEIRRENRPLQYVKKDASGEIVRDSNGMAVMLTDLEAKKKGLPIVSQNMVAVVNGLDVGSVFDSFGVPEVIVSDAYQRRGIGSELLKEYQRVWNRKNLGQATPQGRAMIASLHRKAVGDAIASGKPVPPSVLRDYPDLAAKVSGQDAASVGVTSTPQSQSGGSRSRGQTKPASTDTPRPASPGVVGENTSGGLKDGWRDVRNLIDAAPTTSQADTQSTHNRTRVSDQGVSAREQQSGPGTSSTSRNYPDAESLGPPSASWNENSDTFGLSVDRAVSVWRNTIPKGGMTREEAANEIRRGAPDVFYANVRSEFKKGLETSVKRINDVAAIAGYSVDTPVQRVEQGHVFDGNFVVRLRRSDPLNMTFQGGKKTWQMTGSEYAEVTRPQLGKMRRSVGMGGKNVPRVVSDAINEHRSVVQKAIEAGKQVPENVLADYPDLAKSVPTTKPKGSNPRREGNTSGEGSKPTSPPSKWDVYPISVKGRGTMFAVRESDNPNGFGDTIHASESAAIQYAQDAKERAEKNAATRERDQKAQSEKDAAELARRTERDDIDGFAADATAMQRGRIIQNLNGLIRVDGKADTIKAHVRRMVKEGAELSTREEPKIKQPSRTAWNRMDNRQQAEHERRAKEAGTKTVYLVDGRDLGKTAYDYAKHLLAKSEAKQSTPKPLASNPRRRGAVLNPFEEIADRLREAQAQGRKKAVPNARQMARIEARAAKKAAAILERSERSSAKLAAQLEETKEVQRAYRDVLKESRRDLAVAREDILKLGEKMRAANDKAAIREEARGMVGQLAAHLPVRLRGVLITDVRDAKSMADIYRAVTKAQDAVAKDIGRRAEDVLDRYTSGKVQGKLSDEARKRLAEIERLADDARKRFRAPLASAGDAAVELAELADQARAVVVEYRAENKLIREGRYWDAEIARGKVIDALDKRAKLPPTDTGKGVKQPGLIRRAFRANMDAHTLAAVLDNHAPGEATRLIREIEKGNTRAFELKEAATTQADVAAQRAGYANLASLMAVTSGTLGDGPLVTQKVKLGGKDFTLTLGELAKLYSIEQDVSTRALIAAGKPIQFREGGKFSDPIRLSAQDFATVAEALPQEVKATIDAMKATRDRMFPAVQKVIRFLKGYEPPKEAGYEPRYVNREGQDTTDTDLRPDLSGMMDKHIENAGFTIERVADKKNPLIVGDFFHDWNKSISGQADVIALATPIANARKVLLAPAVKKAIAERFGDKAPERIRRILVDAAGMRADPGSLATMAQRLTRNVSYARTAMRPASWLIQGGGVFRLIPEMPARALAVGVREAFRPGTARAMMEGSARVRKRYSGSLASINTALGDPSSAIAHDSDTTIQKALRAGKAVSQNVKAGDVGGVFNKALPELFETIRISNFFDSIPARVAWAGWQFEARRQGKDQAWAVENFERTVSTVLNWSDPLHLSGYSSALRNTALVPLTAFKADATSAWNQVYRAYGESAEKGNKAALGLALSALWASVITGGAGYLGKLLVEGEDDETAEDEFLTRASIRFLQETLGVGFVGGELTDLATSGVRGFDVDVADAPMVGAMNQTLGSIARMGKAGMDAMGDDPEKAEAAGEKFLDALMRGAEGGAALTGNPLAPAIGTGRKLMKEPDGR